MTKLELSKATAPLLEYVKQLNDELVILALEGKPVAALIPIEEYVDMENLAMRTNPEFLDFLHESRMRNKRENNISLEELRHQLGLDEEGVIEKEEVYDKVAAG